MGDSSRPVLVMWHAAEQNRLSREGLKRILAETPSQPLRMSWSFDELDDFPTYSREHLFILGALDLLKAMQQVARLREQTRSRSIKQGDRSEAWDHQIDGKCPLGSNNARTSGEESDTGGHMGRASATTEFGRVEKSGRPQERRTYKATAMVFRFPSSRPDATAARMRPGKAD